MTIGVINKEGNLKKLQIIELNNNKFSGTLPEAIGTLTNLFVLDIHDNQFTGNVLSFINLIHLNYFDIRKNNFQGSFPSVYYNANIFPNLTYFGVLFNDNLKIPEVCINTPFCYRSIK